MEEILKQLVNNTHPKQIGNKIKANSILFEWLLDNTDHLSGSPSISERVYAILNLISENICNKSGKVKRFISIKDGYGFCGRANSCICTKESVSNIIRKNKNNLTVDQKEEISTKRSKTNLEKYGHANAGQSKKAKLAHQEFYMDKDKVKQQVKKQKRTTLEKYGVNNVAVLDEVKAKREQTNLKKYGVKNVNELNERKEKISLLSKNTWIKRKKGNLDFYKLNEKFKQTCHVEFNISPKNYEGTVGQIYYEFKCIQCLNIFSTYISCGHLPTCKKCHPPRYTFKSGEENEVYEFIKTFNNNIEQKERLLIHPLELDIVDRENKIAVEYCGLYWHAELSNNKDKNYHLNKLIACNNAGFRLITIFSDEWNNKKEIVKSKLNAIFNKKISRIGARHCSVHEIEATEAIQFHNQYHIQGSTNAKTHIGLKLENKLCAVMSFGKNRAFIKNNNNHEIHELIRYSTALPIQGGASKLLKYYAKIYKPNSIVSYADARWSVGNMYLALGFKQVNAGELSPGYWYTNDYITRQHRFNYTKSRLIEQGFNPELTEWEIMQSQGFDRIWDCGQLKFILNS